MAVLGQFVLDNGARIGVGDADYHPFRSFPSQTKIAEMFQVEWLKTTMDQAKRTALAGRSNPRRPVAKRQESQD